MSDGRSSRVRRRNTIGRRPVHRPPDDVDEQVRAERRQAATGDENLGAPVGDAARSTNPATSSASPTFEIHQCEPAM